jgi:TetR/AcrR family transcriptional regulator, regulator of autoinduction and epiphytic fitness
MSRRVNTRSVHRQRQLDLTREVILDAATRLFVAHGYLATTIERIAAAAGVAPSTVYATFGTKVAILGAARWRWAQAAGVPEVREAVRRGAELDRRLALLAALNRRMYDSGIELLEAMRVAASADADAARDWEQVMVERQANLDAAFGDLPPRSRDMVRALLAADVYVETVQRGGWSSEEYERWVSDTLARLVAPSMGPGSQDPSTAPVGSSGVAIVGPSNEPHRAAPGELGGTPQARRRHRVAAAGPSPSPD